jgi:hypothetical protein
MHLVRMIHSHFLVTACEKDSFCGPYPFLFQTTTASVVNLAASVVLYCCGGLSWLHPLVLSDCRLVKHVVRYSRAVGCGEVFGLTDALTLKTFSALACAFCAGVETC